MRSQFEENIENNTWTDTPKNELDELPDIANAEGDEIDNLPDIVEQKDEIDELPEVADVSDEVSREVKELASKYRSIDALYESKALAYASEGKIPAEELPSLSSMKEISKDSAPIEVIQTVVYFSLIRETVAVDISTAVMEHYLNFNVDETYYEEIRDYYHEIVTPEYLQKFYDGLDLTLEQVITELTEITCKAVDAVAYLGANTLLGVAEVVEDAVIFAVGSIADLSGNKELAEKLFKSDFVDDISKVLNDAYDGTELMEKIGNCAKQLGETGTYIALTILAASEAQYLAIAAAVGIGVASAGEATRDAVETTGEYTHRELLCGTISGTISAACTMLISTIDNGMDMLADAVIKKIGKKNGIETVPTAIINAVGVAEKCVSGGIDTAVFESQDILKDFVSKELKIDEDFNVNWNKFFKDVAIGAAINGSVYTISNVSKAVAATYAKTSSELTNESHKILSKATGDMNEIKSISAEVLDNANEKIDDVASQLIDESNIDVKLSESVDSLLNDDGMKTLYEKYPKFAEKINATVDDFKNASTKAERIAALKNLEQYKGTALEDMIKTVLEADFKSEALTQPIVELGNGITTKVDVCMNEAKDALTIANKTIEKGKNICAEVKCGSEKYITSEIDHIVTQISGHAENSFLMVTNDVFQMTENAQNKLMNALAENNTTLCVIDVSAEKVENALVSFVQNVAKGGSLI